MPSVRHMRAQGHPTVTLVKLAAPLLLLTATLMTACGGGNTTETPDTTGPQLTLTQGEPLEDGTVTLTATTTDSSGISKVEFYQNGTLLGTDTTAPYTYAVDLVNDARTGYTAKAYDTKGNATVTAAFNVTTKYQGSWYWLAVDSAGNNVADGVAVFITEVPVNGQQVAAGVYTDTAQTRVGLSLLGPIASTTSLDAAFTVSTTQPALYLVAQDDDGVFGTYNGSATFGGLGLVIDPTTGAERDIALGMVQIDTTVDAAAKAQTTLRAMLKGSLSAQRLNRSARVALPTALNVKLPDLSRFKLPQ